MIRFYCLFHSQSIHQSFDKLSPKKLSDQDHPSSWNVLLAVIQRRKYPGNSTAKKSPTTNDTKSDNMLQWMVMLYHIWISQRFIRMMVVCISVRQAVKLASLSTRPNWTCMVCHIFVPWRKRQLLLVKRWLLHVQLLAIQLNPLYGNEVSVGFWAIVQCLM